MGAGHCGIFTDIFSSICGTGFWEYQTGRLIWVIGHSATGYQTIKMPEAKYMSLNISLAEARAKAVFLQTKCIRKGAHVKLVNFSKFLTNCVKFWPTFYIKNVWENSWPKKEDSLHPSLPQLTRPGLPLTSRPFVKGQSNQKLCLSFCHSLLSHPTSFFCTIYCIEFWFFGWLFLPPNIHSASDPYNISVDCVFW